MLGDVLRYLACPHCRRGLTDDGRALRCARRHEFDVARQGYVNLLAGKNSAAGDSADMVSARADFLAAGHYRPIEHAVVAAATGTLDGDGCVVDFGAGTGHYLAAVLDAAPGRVGIGLEVAKPALRRLARAHGRIGAVGCDVWGRVPVVDGRAALVLNVFAPRNPPEIHRVLTRSGALVVVMPTERHLAGLVAGLGLLSVAPDKRERVTEALEPYLKLCTEDECEFAMSLSHQEIGLLVGMGPSAWHVEAAALRDRIAGLPVPAQVTASVRVSVYRRR